LTTHVDKLLTIDWYGVIDTVLTQIKSRYNWKGSFCNGPTEAYNKMISIYTVAIYYFYIKKKTSRIIFTHAGTTIMSRSLFDTAHKVNGIPFSIPRWWHYIFKLLDSGFTRGREGKVVIKQFYQAYTTWWM
jgi:hypothetical protein